MRVFADVAYLLEYKQSNIKSDGNPKQDIQTGGAYESPSLTALDVRSEGLLCQSAQYDRADVDYGFKDLGEI